MDRQEQSLKDSDSRVKDLERELQEAPTREVVEAALEAGQSGSRSVAEGERQEKEASDRLAETQKVANALEGDEKRAWQNYDTQRDLLAEMQPPAAERENLAVAWDSLAGWAKKQLERQRALDEKAEEERKTVESALNDLRESIAEWCSDASVAVADGEEPLTVCSREQGLQAVEVKRIGQALDDLNQKRYDLKLRRKEGLVAADLARH